MSLIEAYHLKKVDQKILAFISERLTYQEMANALGRSARSGIYFRVERLIALDLVTKSERKSRSRRLTEQGQEVLDSISSL